MTHADIRNRTASPSIASIYLDPNRGALKQPPAIQSRLSRQELVRIATEGAEFKLKRGELLFRQGSQHTGIYLIRTGRIRTFYISPNGREITLALWGAQTFVGGPELFGEGTHQWSGVALCDTEVLYLNGAQVTRLIRECPALAMALIDTLIFKGRCFSNLIQLLGTRSASARLAHALLALGEASTKTISGFTVVAGVTHDDLASLIGVTRQWISMTLKKFREDGLIAFEGRRILLIDAPGLQDVAAS